MINIRDFKIEDKETLTAFAFEFYNSSAVSHPIPVANFVSCFNEIINNNPFVRGLAIEYNNELAGYCQLSFTYSSEAGGLVVLIEEVYISPKFQKKGLANAVISFIKTDYKNKAKRLRLECQEDNEVALNLYKKHSFEQLDYLQLIIE